MLAPYRRAHPDVLLSVRFGHSVALAQDVLDDELDLAYLQGWQVPTNVRYERLHQLRFTLLVAPSHPLARAVTVTAAQVARAGLITAPLDDVEWVHYEQVLREIDLGPSDTTLEINGIQARFLATAAGMGVVGVSVPPTPTTTPVTPSQRCEWTDRCRASRQASSASTPTPRPPPYRPWDCLMTGVTGVGGSVDG
ncbi:substrate-binding domain-containing protein [Actinomycetospora lutea]|uniref:substrate-binding domain-containing protein n=1 Tax=Actinomycetospora lutea TaxID=663604 RepID=UPI0023657DF9|nr:substrate-binding domain-containing protein [Actinomycetospora lutea]MDD7942903.1 substrate-binding domain-containing protein [Actinomycetospora lutea]